MWYKYSDEKCVKDCKAGGAGKECGGVAASWDPKFDTRKECCQKAIWWEPIKDCDK